MRVKLVSTMFLGWLLSHFAAAQHDLNLSPVRASFPEKPVMRTSSESTVVGSVTSENYTLSGKDYNLVLSTSQLPALALTFRSPDALYKDASEALLKEHQGARQLSYQEAKVGGKSGAEMSFRGGNGDQGKARFVLVGEKLVVAEALWKNPASQAEADRFLNSLAIAD
ncbi:MAG: hypothetical protein KF760_21025 [Candidatus Eremiobacteraeota bacterium]|nr:hypothetical protein [Candidatus Eremiobacteraeota bacterium]